MQPLITVFHCHLSLIRGGRLTKMSSVCRGREEACNYNQLTRGAKWIYYWCCVSGMQNWNTDNPFLENIVCIESSISLSVCLYVHLCLCWCIGLFITVLVGFSYKEGNTLFHIKDWLGGWFAVHAINLELDAQNIETVASLSVCYPGQWR